MSPLKHEVHGRLLSVDRVGGSDTREAKKSVA